MPELPEVETTRRGIKKHIVNVPITAVIIRNRNLRWPVPTILKKELTGNCFTKVDRRAKYLLIWLDTGCVILHLGMSGSLRLVSAGTPPAKHDHLDICFDSNKILRFRDPRRFGSIHWTRKDPYKHKLLVNLGPEPLSKFFSGNYLFIKSRQRKQAIKTFIMDSHVVVGIGNIYASEALFHAGIHPARAAGNISEQRCNKLADSVKTILEMAISKGGTTLRNFTNEAGEPGYFKIDISVYDCEGEPCGRCGHKIKQLRQGQRSTYYCPGCQR